MENNPKHQLPKLSDITKSWKFYLINGKLLQRVPYRANQHNPTKCPECNCKHKKLHKLGCKLEKSPCKDHKLVVECDCDLRPGEKV